jgi:hypothetical protein
MAQVLPAERDLRRIIGDGHTVPDDQPAAPASSSAIETIDRPPLQAGSSEIELWSQHDAPHPFGHERRLIQVVDRDHGGSIPGELHVDLPVRGVPRVSARAGAHPVSRGLLREKRMGTMSATTTTTVDIATTDFLTDEHAVEAFEALGKAGDKAERMLMTARRFRIQERTPTLGQRGTLREFQRELTSEAQHLAELADELDEAIDECRFPWPDSTAHARDEASALSR